MMGQLIKNKLMQAKSSFVLSSIENCMSNFEDMYNMNSNAASIPNDLWVGMWSNLFQTFANFSNLNTISGLASDSSADDKVECINLIEAIENLTKIIWMSNANHEYDINLQFDQGIPDKLYGNAQKVKQVLTVLFSFAVKLSCAHTPTTCTVKFLRMQSGGATTEKLYLIGVSICIPSSDGLSVETLSRIFANKTFGSEFYVEFKEELKLYDLGLFIVSHIAQQCGISLK